MLEWAIVFLVIALVAGALGYTGLARGASRIAVNLCWAFFALFVFTVVLALLQILLMI